MSHLLDRDADQMQTNPAATPDGNRRNPWEIVAFQGFYSEPGIGLEPMTFSLQERCSSN